MKRFARILCCLTVLALLFSAAPAKAHAANGTPCTLCGDSCGGIVTDSQPLHRVYGATRYETSFALSDLLLKRLNLEQYNTVLVASGTGFADALAGSYLAAKYNAPILLTSGKTEDQVRRYIQEKVKPDGSVIILGGTQAVSGNLAGSLAGYRVTRLWGNTRYETNLEILNFVSERKAEVVVCTGKGFADSLSASAVGKPILLVGDSLTNAQKDFLNANADYHYIIGGTGAVSEQVEQQLRAYGAVERIGGNTRYETSALVAERFFPNADGAMLAYAQNFPDGLCGGTLAHLDGWPMLLVADGKGEDAKAYAQEREILKGYVLGGPGLISDATVRDVYARARGTSDTRPSYDLGNCRTLSGEVCAILLFVDDNETSWTKAEVDEEWNEHVIPGLDFLETWAANWGVELNFTTYGYYTGMNENTTVKYDGHIYRQPSDAWQNRSILEDIALSLGFSDADDMDQFLRDFSGQDQIVYMVMANKDGRCYAYPDDTNDQDDDLEHCMIFTDFTDYSYEGTPATIAHELLHLFGAEDYYDPYGNFPNRHAMAEELYYNDIMLRTYVKDAYEEYNTIGAFTAYSVGWLDTCPPECLDERWWS